MKVNGLDFLSIKGKVKFIECDALKYPNFSDVEKAIKNDEAIVSMWHINIIPTVGRIAIARRLANIGLKANESIITYGAVGTGTSNPENANVKLDNEGFRKLVASTSYNLNTAEIRIFFNTSEANETWTEYGLFGEDATASADSGTLFERLLINKTKTSAKTLTIISQITIN